VQIVIMGCGRCGSTLAARLASDNHRVFVIDTDHRNFARLPRSLVESGAITVVEGDGTGSAALQSADIEDADVFIAVSGRDTLNGLAAQKVRHYHRKRHVICRVKDEDLRQLYEATGVSTMNPTELVADRILAHLPEAPG